MLTSIRSGLLTSFLFMLAPCAWAAPDGAALYKAQCSACHGAKALGQEAAGAPPLARQDESYLIRQLGHFREGRRGGPGSSDRAAAMRAIAQTLKDDAAVAALARHLSRLPVPARQAVEAPPGSPALAGKAQYSVCMACHGGVGEGNAALAAPRLNTLPAWYTAAQLKAFREGHRGSGPEDVPGQQMRKMALEALADDEAVDAVSAFITTLGTSR